MLVSDSVVLESASADTTRSCEPGVMSHDCTDLWSHSVCVGGPDDLSVVSGNRGVV